MSVDSLKETKWRKSSQAVKEVASKLGNRAAACRKYYVHPAILEAYSEGRLLSAFAPPASGVPEMLDPDEAAILRTLAKWNEGTKAA